MISEEERRETKRKTAIAALAKGSELPAYMETLDIRDRIIIVNALNEFSGQLGPELITALIAYPGFLATVLDPETKAQFDEIGVHARKHMAAWIHPAQNARYN